MNNEKGIIMHETAQHLINMIQNRVKSRMEALSALNMSSIDAANIPDDIKKMREIECSNIRAVMQEQTDLIAIIQILYPKTKSSSTKK